MHRHEHRARHRRVVGHQLEEHQPGADRGLGHDQHAGQDRPEPGGMTGPAGAENPDDQRGDREQGETAGEPVGELDHRRQLRGARTTSPLQSGQ